MTSLAHQQRMMEVQHASSAFLVTLLPHVQESLLGMCGGGLGSTSTAQLSILKSDCAQPVG